LDHAKSGTVIRSLRHEKGLTQKQLAEMMNITDKTISKWERGLGLPDIALLPELSRILSADIEYLISGEYSAGYNDGGNMKKLKFYVCPLCGNILTASSSNAAVTCCGKILDPLTAQKPDELHSLAIEHIETDIFIHSDHEMTKQHYISFAAILTGDSLTLRRLYPEWNMQTRFSLAKHGTLLWYCTSHGLFYKYI